MLTKAITMPDYNTNLIRAILSFKVNELEIGALAPDEVLVKCFASPINPSDIAFVRGGYNIRKSLPATPGFEASGEVVDAGENCLNMVGKKIACFSQDDNSGAWSQYFKTKAENCIALKPGIDLEQAACLSINPLTAFGMFEMVLEGGFDTIVLSAAGSRVAQHVRTLADLHGVNTINIVRSHEKADSLSGSLNPEYHQVIALGDDFNEKIGVALGKSIKAIALDAIGGEFAGSLFNILPEDSVLVLYGALAEGDIKGIEALGLIFNNKKIMGFNLNDWVANNKGGGTYEEKVDMVQDMIIEGKMKTPIANSFPLAETVTAMREYIKNMSVGKILIKPND